MDQTFEKRKKVIYDFICDDFYIPMKVNHGNIPSEHPWIWICYGRG